MLLALLREVEQRRYSSNLEEYCFSSDMIGQFLGDLRYGITFFGSSKREAMSIGFAGCNILGEEWGGRTPFDKNRLNDLSVEIKAKEIYVEELRKTTDTAKAEFLDDYRNDTSDKYEKLASPGYFQYFPAQGEKMKKYIDAKSKLAIAEIEYEMLVELNNI